MNLDPTPSTALLGRCAAPVRAATLALAAVAATSLDAEPLTRAQVVARALEANPSVQRGLQDLALLNGRKREALADALPSLTLEGSFMRFRDPALLNSSSFDNFPPELRDSLRPVPANLYESAVELRQTLFSFKIGRALRAARWARVLGDEQLRQVRQEVALEAVRAYNDFLLGLEKARVAEKAVRQKERHLEMAQNRRRAGVATDLDVLRSQVDLENTRVMLRRLRGSADLARATLNAVMVRPVDAEIEPVDGLDYLALDMTLDEAVREAWTRRPEALALDLSARVYDEFVGLARAEGQPSLDFTGRFGWSVRQPRNFFDRDFTAWSASVALNVPLFDGHRTAARVAQARAERAKLTHERVALENRIRLQARDALDRLNVARGIFEAAELNVSQAQRALDLTQANYNHGAATTLDVIDAQAALTVAESARIEALYDHANARASLRWVTARDVLDPPAPPTKPVEATGASDPAGARP